MSFAAGLAAPALESARALLEEAARDRRALSALAGGGILGELEDAFATAAGAPFALAVSSGTAALHAALLATDIGPGDEVILAAYGWGQTAAAVLATGATPVFADVSLATGNLDPVSAIERIGSTTRAILVTHLFGCPAPMDALRASAMPPAPAPALSARWRLVPSRTRSPAQAHELAGGRLPGRGAALPRRSIAREYSRSWCIRPTRSRCLHSSASSRSEDSGSRESPITA